MLADQLAGYEGMQFSQIWQAMDEGQPEEDKDRPEDKGRSEEFALLQNRPNPFNPDTWIPYRLKEDAHVLIRIYATTGQLIRTLNLGHKPAGFYMGRTKAAHWDGQNEAGERVTSGIYFYNIQAGSYSATRKMMVVQ
jgi:hypothetical protein